NRRIPVNGDRLSRAVERYRQGSYRQPAPPISPYVYGAGGGGFGGGGFCGGGFWGGGLRRGRRWGRGRGGAGGGRGGGGGGATRAAAVRPGNEAKPICGWGSILR